MKNKTTISLIDEDGKAKEYSIILTFEVEENDNLYIVYTDNEKDEDGLTKTYAGIYHNNDGKESLLPIQTEAEWDLVEKLLAKVDDKNNRE